MTDRLPVLDHDLALQRLYHFERTEPDRVVFTQPLGGGRVVTLTWRTVMDEVRRMATHLVARRLPPGSRIGLLSKNTAHWLMADFAIWMAGHVSVPLYPTLAARTVRSILEHSEASLLFVGKLDHWDELRPGIPASLPCIRLPLAPQGAWPSWDTIVNETAPLQGHLVRGADELATIVYTSGTTGEPKGVMHTFGGLAWVTRCGLQRIPLNAEARVLSYLPLAHVAERMLVEHGLLASGMHVFFAESVDTFAHDLRRARPTVFFSVPRLWVKFRQGVLQKMPQRRLSRLIGLPVVGRLVKRRILAALGLDRCVFAVGGAAPMPPDLLEWYARLGLPIAEVYGMTENGVLSHSTWPARPRPGTVGWTFDGIASRIDASTGEIQLRTPGVMRGYFKDPVLTQQAFTPDGWLRTGDCGELDGEGALRITGRIKDLFKTSKGKYVAPAPIEERLAAHPDVEACMVAGARLAQPLALVLLGEAAIARSCEPAERAALESSLQAHLEDVNRALDPHERLSCLVVTTTAWTVHNGLVTPTLKLRRNRAEALFGSHYERWAALRRPIVWDDTARRVADTPQSPRVPLRAGA